MEGRVRVAPSNSETESRARAFYDRIAPEYDRDMEAPAAREIRERLWRHAELQLQPHARILDFGAGSGIDAEHFADRGHTVVAFDVSAGVLEVLRSRCARHLASGAVTVLAGDLVALRTRLQALPPFDAVICNFAVLNLIEDLQPVFDLFAARLRPGGKVLITIQNPWALGDVLSRAFVKSLLSFPRHGVMRYPSADSGYTYRHLPLQLRRAAGRRFRSLPWRPLDDTDRRHFGFRRVFRLVMLERR
jgi:SAM-dependent methyltransferase